VKTFITVLIMMLSTSNVFAADCGFKGTVKQVTLSRAQVELAIIERELAPSAQAMHQSEQEIIAYTSSLQVNSNKLYSALKCLESAGVIILPQDQDGIFERAKRIRELQMMLDGFVTRKTKELHHNAYSELGRADGMMTVLDFTKTTK